jgi:uncharacterized protein (DUF362 family)
MAKVSLVKTEGGIQEALVRALDLIGGLGRFVGRSDRVLLKPNLNDEEVYTSPELVAALIELLRDQGAGEIAIGESTFGDARMTAALLRKTGFAELATRYGIALYNLNASQAVEMEVVRPLVAGTVRVAREFVEADRVINLPNMKVHYATGITLALKNLKGVLVGDEKRRFHEIGLAKAIVDLNNTVRANLQIADCTRCMERMGPRGGDPVQLDALIAGESAAEVDWVGCQVMSHSLDDVEHLRLFVEMNGIDLGQVEPAGEPIAAVRRPFKKAALQSRPPACFSVHVQDACSACMNAFLLSCMTLGAEPQAPAEVFLGRLDDGRPAPSGFRIAFGNCVPAQGTFDLRIKGCPPYPFALKAALAKRAATP